MQVLPALGAANAEFLGRLRRVAAEDWSRPTPCDAWDVRALVNHVVGGNTRYVMLLHGATPADVDATRTADHLGSDPAVAFERSAGRLRAAFAEDGAMARIGRHPAGDRTGAELAEMRVLDITVHAWDLGRAIGADDPLDAGIVEFALTCAPHIEILGPRGYFAPPGADLPQDPSPQQLLLHLTGRRAGWPG